MYTRESDAIYVYGYNQLTMYNMIHDHLGGCYLEAHRFVVASIKDVSCKPMPTFVIKLVSLREMSQWRREREREGKRPSDIESE